MSTLKETTYNVYKEAASAPDIGLCCTTNPVWQLPGLVIPQKMIDMNYGCGSTVHPRDLAHNPRILYIGIVGGMELLQFSYFNRQAHGVVGIDVVDEMIITCKENLIEAESLNEWFKKDFVDIKKGDAMNLPIEDNSVDVAAQNCLFNIFEKDDIEKALAEVYRTLKPNGRLVLSDPVSENKMPETLKRDPKLRALCLSGALPLKEYITMITNAGFGTVEIRAKRPYRILSPRHFDTTETIFIESVEICAIKDPVPDDGPCVFSGRTAIYFGAENFFDDNNGHLLQQNQPLSICDKTALKLESLERNDIFISDSTYFYDGGGCC